MLNLDHRMRSIARLFRPHVETLETHRVITAASRLVGFDQPNFMTMAPLSAVSAIAYCKFDRIWLNLSRLWDEDFSPDSRA